VISTPEQARTNNSVHPDGGDREDNEADNLAALPNRQGN